MKQMNKFLAAGGAVVLLALTGCGHKGPAEKAGEQIDKAAANTGDAIDDAKDKASALMDKLKK